MKRLTLCILLLLGVFGVAIAQDDDTRPIEPRTRGLIYAGPGSTHLPVDRIAWQDDFTLTARNAAGTWVQAEIQRGTATTIDGWVQTGHLIFNEPFSVDELPITELPDGDPETINSRSRAQLAEVPIISEIAPSLQDVYDLGRELGNQPGVVTKIGDSVSDSPVFLGALNPTDFDLGPHSGLQRTVEWFSVPEASAASRIGMTTYVIFDPFWALPDLCEPNETPLQCELRRTQPVAAFILFGPNDVRAMDDEQFSIQMTRVIEETLAAGVIPVLITFSVDDDDPLVLQAIQFNLRLTELAETFEIPLINYWLAAQALPEYGLDEDAVHLTHSGFVNMTYSTGHEAYYGMSLLNLLVARTLDNLRVALNLNGEA